jgi:predicted RecB family nuclease
MQKIHGSLLYSPSDLNAFLENECITWLDRYDLEYPGELERDVTSEEEELISGAGDEHERRHLARLRAEDEVAIINRDSASAYADTITAMRRGAPVIYQARLERGEFAGWADFLLRADGASELGGWHYEVWDTKLARGMKPYFAIQLCSYAEMLEEVQHVRAVQAGIILGNLERKPLRLSDYWFYYRAVKRAFLEQQRLFDRNSPPPFPALADYRHWSGHVARRLEARRDVSMVANIRSAQIAKLSEAGITTLPELAETRLASVPRLAQATFDRLRAQARLQERSQPGEPPAYELLPTNPNLPRQGLASLPPASEGDVAFDIEGYPLIDGGLEYLLGATVEEEGKLAFLEWWAHDPVQEKRSFERFVDWVYARWKQYPSMHVYHYAPYETTALKRLMSRYATREDEVDELLRNQVFVDLYSVVRQALLVGEPAYSLKNIEHLYLPKRAGEVATAGESMVYYHRWLTARDGESWSESPTLKLIRDYNQADCESTWQLIDWLRERQLESDRNFVAPEAPGEVSEVSTARAALARAMLAEIPGDRSTDAERWRVHELLAHLLEFHRREHKSLYWAKYQRMEMTEAELLENRECLAGAERTATPPQPVKQSFIYEYCFPEQETKLRAGDKCFLACDGKTRATIETLYPDHRVLTFKRGRKIGPLPDRVSLIPDEIVGTKLIDDSIERTVRGYLANGTLPPSLQQFLFRLSPRLAGRNDGPIIPSGQDVFEGSLAAVTSLDGGTLCIQGPPGSGKTTKGGRLIAELLRRGKRVGISSNSHDAICVLMKAAAGQAQELGIAFTAAKCGEEDRQPPHPAIDMIRENGDLFLAPLPDLVGGTAWLFSRPEARGAFDYLFVDEAGQVSVANLVGMTPAARNIVILGDQMQLGQPIRGVHPGESGSSVLEYYLQDHATVPEEKGIFLPSTYRMRREICNFISDAVYEGRLQADACTAERTIRFAGPTRRVGKEAGILYVPVEHQDNTYESDEEAAAIVEIVGELLGHDLAEAGRPARKLTRKDILVVAPFNMQVRKLQALLPGVRVGTVDKFQGQQAPVVIFSMTASEGDAAPRGLEFLFDKQRLNVAISRAQVLAVVVASPALERTRCTSLEQMRALNVYCRALEAAVQVRTA